MNLTLKIVFLSFPRNTCDAHIGQGQGEVEGNDTVDSRGLYLARLVTASFTYHISDPSVPRTVRLLIEVSDYLIDILQSIRLIAVTLHFDVKSSSAYNMTSLSSKGKALLDDKIVCSLLTQQ